MMLQKIKAVIWDVDGTMVDSQPLHDRSWDKALINYGHSLTDVSPNILRYKAGKKPIVIAEEIIKDLKLAVDATDLFITKTNYFMASLTTELAPMPGLSETVKSLYQAGYRQAIGSSMTAEYVALTLNKYKLTTYFEVVVTGEQVIKGKPDPEIYIVVAEKLGLQPQECVVIEDATSGIKAAKAAGCLCIALLNPDEAENTSEADIVVAKLTEVIEQLN